jgi:hypothetical protein
MGSWITLHDRVWTPEKITAEVAGRAKARESELGHLEISIPPFKYLKDAPQPPQDRPYNIDLYNHLNELNKAPALEIKPAYEVNSPAQIFWLGSIWNRLHAKINDLILFYINRAAQQQSQINEELTISLNELTRFVTRSVESEQEPTQRLRDEFSEQKEPGEKT